MTKETGEASFPDPDVGPPPGAVQGRIETELARLAMPPGLDGWHDPARAAALLMVEAAFKESGVPVERAAARNEIFAVTLPSKDWAAPVREIWREVLIRPGVRTRDAEIGGVPPGTDVVFLRIDGLPPASRHIQDALIQAIAIGCLLVVLAADRSRLPKDIRLAGQPIDVVPVRPATVAALAELLYGAAPTLLLEESQAAGLTPHFLRLSRRPGNSADGFLGLLAACVDGTQPKETSVDVGAPANRCPAGAGQAGSPAAPGGREFPSMPVATEELLPGDQGAPGSAATEREGAPALTATSQPRGAEVVRVVEGTTSGSKASASLLAHEDKAEDGDRLRSLVGPTDAVDQLVDATQLAGQPGGSRTGRTPWWLLPRLPLTASRRGGGRERDEPASDRTE